MFCFQLLLTYFFTTFVKKIYSQLKLFTNFVHFICLIFNWTELIILMLVNTLLTNVHSFSSHLLLTAFVHKFLLSFVNKFVNYFFLSNFCSKLFAIFSQLLFITNVNDICYHLLSETLDVHCSSLLLWTTLLDNCCAELKWLIEALFCILIPGMLNILGSLSQGIELVSST